MATTDKDFKVKNGLVVTNGGSFGGTVSVATPVLGTDAATKAYVDSVAGTPTVPVTETEPVSPQEGDLWFDIVTKRLHIYHLSEWIAIATLQDAESLQDHIHDTSIDGTGRIVSVFVSGGAFNSPGVIVSAGFYNTTEWETVWNGGIAIDNFN